MLARLLLPFSSFLIAAPLAAQKPPRQYDAGPWHNALGLSIGTPGGFGAQLELRVWGPVWARAALRGMWGTLPRGGGIEIHVANGRDGRLYATGMVGTIACYGDRDGVCSGMPTDHSAAWSFGVGGEFPVSQAIGVGIEVDRWFASTGPHPSINAAVFLIRGHL